MRRKMMRVVGNMSPFLQAGLAFQHLLAVFAGTVFVPIATGLSVSVALFFSGVATLVFHFFTRGKIPLYYGSSFTMLAGMVFIRQSCVNRGMPDDKALCYVSFGVFVIGIVCLVMAQLLRSVSEVVIKRIFTPVVTGSFIMALGVDMLFSSTANISEAPLIGIMTIVVLVVALVFSRGIIGLMSINVSVLIVVMYVALTDGIDVSEVVNAEWIRLPFTHENIAFGILEDYDPEMLSLSIMTSLPFAFITMAEHITDVLAVSRTVGIDYMKTVGLSRTLSANGLGTMFGAVFGAPPSTAYTQTTGLLSLNRICAPRLLRLCALMMILLSFSPKLSAVIGLIPIAAIGGITQVMYCMVVVVGFRTLTGTGERVLSLRSIVIVLAVLGITVYIKFLHSGNIGVMGVDLSSLVVAWAVGVLLNVIIPEKKKKNDE